MCYMSCQKNVVVSLFYSVNQPNPLFRFYLSLSGQKQKPFVEFDNNFLPKVLFHPKTSGKLVVACY